MPTNFYALLSNKFNSNFMCDIATLHFKVTLKFAMNERIVILYNM